jgi:hypothetical protein
MQSTVQLQQPLRRRFPHWRKMTWALIVWTVLILVWAIAGGKSGNHQSLQRCLNEGVLTQQQCKDAVGAGTGIGVALILVLGFFGFVILSLVWFMTRPRQVIVVQQGHPDGSITASPGSDTSHTYVQPQPGQADAPAPIEPSADSPMMQAYQRRPPSHHSN